jgi:opacity protein-like surface antigen
MKKLLVLAAVLIISSTGAFAFDILSYPPPVSGGNIMIDVGIGFVSTINNSLSLPPLRVSVDYTLPVRVPISVGGLFAFYRSLIQKDVGNYSWNHFLMLGRANWHWGFDLDWLDLYTGFSLGYRHTTFSYDPTPGYSRSDWETYYEDDGGFSGGGQAGAHFYLTNFFGAFVEFGYPLYANFGFALKF